MICFTGDRGKDARYCSAILFDFDGTLATLNVDFGSMRAGLLSRIQSYGLDVDRFKDLYALEMIDRATEELEPVRPDAVPVLKEECLSLIRDVEMEGARRGMLFDGIRDMFRILRQKNIKTAVVTRNCFDAVSCIYQGIEVECDAVVSREFTQRVKPHPQHLITALALLGVEASQAVMAGDHPMDISAGKAVGAYTIGVLSGYSGTEPLREAQADLILDHITDLLTAL